MKIFYIFLIFFICLNACKVREALDDKPQYSILEAYMVFSSFFDVITDMTALEPNPNPCISGSVEKTGGDLETFIFNKCEVKLDGIKEDCSLGYEPTVFLTGEIEIPNVDEEVTMIGNISVIGALGVLNCDFNLDITFLNSESDEIISFTGNLCGYDNTDEMFDNVVSELVIYDLDYSDFSNEMRNLIEEMCVKL